MLRTYSELIRISTFEERYNYLRLHGQIGADTFGFERYLNQRFYNSAEWKSVRDKVIVRDKCCDLGMEGFEIYTRPIIHHLNPITVDDISEATDILLNPEYLITTTLNTHNAIHYGNLDCQSLRPVERKPNDTCPWKNLRKE